MSRVRVAVALALAGILLACTAPAIAPTAPQATPPVHPVNVDVSAHPDDDILFMNPDLAAGIRAGQDTVGIYLTAGESALPDSAGYAARRQAGTRASYAVMAGMPDNWAKYELPLDRLRSAELYELIGRPGVRLVFLNLPDDNNPRAAGGRHALTRLWQQPGTEVDTLVPRGGAVPVSYSYRREDVIAALATLFTRFAPTVVRTQDPAPDKRYQPEWREHADHPDHVMAARFTREAEQRYLATNPARRPVRFEFRDYNGADAPVNLSPAEQRRKHDYFAAYAPHDSEVGLGPPYDAWIRRTYYRWPKGNWAAHTPDGRLHAYAVTGERVLRWTRGQDGRWAAAAEVPGIPGAPAPTLSMAGAAVFGLAGTPPRITVNADPAGPGSPLWTDLGTPSPGNEDQVGVPAGVTDGQQRLAVFVKNAGGGLSVRRQSVPGRWEPDWQNAGGETDLQDGIAALTGADGRLHAFAATRERIRHWAEQTPGGQLVPQPDVLPELRPASPPAAVVGADGRLRIAFRLADTGELATAVLDQRGWRPPTRLAAPGGVGAPALAAGRKAVPSTIVVRDDAGGVVVAAARPDGTVGGWANLGGQVLDHPAAVVEPDGRVTLIALGPDGNPVSTTGSGDRYDGWRPAAP